MAPCTPRAAAPRGRWWARVAERANGMPLFPLTVEEVRAALDAFSGGLWMRPLSPQNWQSHNHTVCCPYVATGDNSMGDLQRSVAHALDEWAYQTNSPILEDAGAVCTFLRGLVEAYEVHECAAQLAALRNVLTMLDRGELYVQPFNPERDLRQHGRQLKHSIWVRGAESGIALDDSRWPAMECLQQTLDTAQQRSGGAFCQSSDQARAVLLAAIASLEHA